MSAEPKLCPMQHSKGTCSHGSKRQAPYTAGHSYGETGSEQSLKPGWCVHANTRQLYLKNVPSSVSTVQLQHEGPGKLLDRGDSVILQQ